MLYCTPICPAPVPCCCFFFSVCFVCLFLKIEWCLLCCERDGGYCWSAQASKIPVKKIIIYFLHEWKRILSRWRETSLVRKNRIQKLVSPPPPPPTPSLHTHNIHSPCVSSFCFLSVMYIHITATVSSSWYSGLVWHHPVPVLIMDDPSWALPVSASRECRVGSGMRKLSEWEHVQQDCQFSAHFPTPLGICVQAEQWSLWTLSRVASVQNAARVRQRCHIRCRYGYTGVPRCPVYFGHMKQTLSQSLLPTASLSLLFFFFLFFFLSCTVLAYIWNIYMYVVSLALCVVSVELSPLFARAGCKKTLWLFHHLSKIQFIHSFSAN